LNAGWVSPILEFRSDWAGYPAIANLMDEATQFFKLSEL
jgi:hypothetical protein